MEQNIAAILEKYAWLYNPEIVRRVEETYRAETGAENKERLRRVYYYLLEGYIGQRTASGRRSRLLRGGRYRRGRRRENPTTTCPC